MGGLKALVKVWINETNIYSNPLKCLHSSYFDTMQKYPKEELINTLLDILEESAMMQPMMALEKITGENPVPSEHRGYVAEMRQDWLNWRKNRS